MDGEATPLTVGICVPTIREAAIAAFVRAWTPHWVKQSSSVALKVFVHEDCPRKTFQLPAVPQLALVHTAHDDIPGALGASAWIIPRGSGACRSFPMYLAWKAGCDYIITLDDDCYPEPGGDDGFIDRHLSAFRQDRWFRTISGDVPRGVPYQRLGQLAVRVNHGLWSETPDLDGPTSLVRMREPRAALLRSGQDVVPPGMAFPMCAMNVCYHRSIIPAAYNLLMGLDTVGLDRFDDIWSGLLVKRVLDYRGWYVTTGEPFVRHVKQSDCFTNLRREALGIQIHEHLWEYLLDAPLEPGLTVTDAFKALAARLRTFPDAFPALPCPPGYFPQLAAGMVAWAELFEGPET